MMNELTPLQSQKILKTILISFILAFLLSAIPLPYTYFFWVPDWVAVLLIFWAINYPRLINLGTAFVLGVFVDILYGSPLGAHSLAYCVGIYFVLTRRQFLNLYSVGGQALSVTLTLLVMLIIVSMIVFIFDHQFVGWLYLVSPLTAALLWPLFNKLMYAIPSLSRH